MRPANEDRQIKLKTYFEYLRGIDSEEVAAAGTSAVSIPRPVGKKNSAVEPTTSRPPPQHSVRAAADRR